MNENVIAFSNHPFEIIAKMLQNQAFLKNTGLVLDQF